MAMSFKKKSIKDTEGSNFGNYSEYNGGGSPKGGMYGGQNGRVGWPEREAAGEVKGGQHRVDQPRTSDGKFTYNSVNGKELKYESRGVTVNPLLTNGENGVYIDDVAEQFKNKKGDYYNKFKDRFYTIASEKVVMDNKGKLHVALSSENIWDIARRSWDVKKGELSGESSAFGTYKAGKPSAAEKSAKDLAKQAGGEQYVNDGTGGIAEHATGKLKEKKDNYKPIERYHFAKQHRYSIRDPRSWAVGIGTVPLTPTQEQKVKSTFVKSSTPKPASTPANAPVNTPNNAPVNTPNNAPESTNKKGAFTPEAKAEAIKKLSSFIPSSVLEEWSDEQIQNAAQYLG